MFSEEGLRALQDRLAAHVERDALPGYVALVARGGSGVGRRGGGQGTQEERPHSETTSFALPH